MTSVSTGGGVRGYPPALKNLLYKIFWISHNAIR